MMMLKLSVTCLTILLLMRIEPVTCDTSGAYTSPDNSYKLTWTLDEATDDWNVTLISTQPAGSWAGFAIGRTPLMEMQDVFIVYMDSSGVGKCLDMWVGSHYSAPILDPTQNLVCKSVTYVSGTYTFVFSRLRNTADTANDIQLTNTPDLYFKYVVGGGAMSGSNVMKHFNTPIVSGSTICVCPASSAMTTAGSVQQMTSGASSMASSMASGASSMASSMASGASSMASSMASGASSMASSMASPPPSAASPPPSGASMPPSMPPSGASMMPSGASMMPSGASMMPSGASMMPSGASVPPSAPPSGASMPPSGPSMAPPSGPSMAPPSGPSMAPSPPPSGGSMGPSGQPSMAPSMGPSGQPSMGPSGEPSMGPSGEPSMGPPGTGTPSSSGGGGGTSSSTTRKTIIASLVVFGVLSSIVLLACCCFTTAAVSTRSPRHRRF